MKPLLKEQLQSVPLKDVRIADEFWGKYLSLVADVVLPHQWALINDQVEGAEKSHCIQNFKIAAGLEQGTHQGTVFLDTDVAKWIEAAAYHLESSPDSVLEKLVDYAVEMIAGAQCEDGYLNTYYTLTAPDKRWSNLFEGHELYNAGHLIEASVAYYNATGKRRFLDVMCRFADCICATFGNEEGKIPGYPGHPEVELALGKLYNATGCRQYLDMSRFFVEQRGKDPVYFLHGERHSSEECCCAGEYIFPEFKDFGMDYCQAHKPCREQNTAEGHAVRAVYLYCAMADLAYAYKDDGLLENCRVLYDSIVEKRMYLTGSIGSAAYGERFTTDYDLPNDTNYSETCASIGLAMFAYRMFRNTGDGRYMDTVERALYNTLLSGISLDGQHFFYVNPLEVIPEVAEKNPTMRHVKTERQKWFGVACCPPNISRTLASLGGYIYSYAPDSVYINLFIQGSASFSVGGGVTLRQKTHYPNGGAVEIAVEANQPTRFILAMRIPAHAKSWEITVGGERQDCICENGYIRLTKEWYGTEIVLLTLDIPPRFVMSNPRVAANAGKVALMKGPVVYCFEEQDCFPGLAGLELETSMGITEKYEKALLGGTLTLQVSGRIPDAEAYPDNLYFDLQEHSKNVTATAIPYCLWNNRGRGEMRVWVAAAH